MQSFEGLRKGFNGQIFRIVLTENHAIDQMKDGAFVTLHQLGKCFLILFLGGSQNEGVVVLGFFREVWIHFHKVDSDVDPLHQAQTRNALTTGSNRSSHASRRGKPALRKNVPKVSVRINTENPARLMDVPEGLWTTPATSSPHPNPGNNNLTLTRMG